LLVLIRIQIVQAAGESLERGVLRAGHDTDHVGRVGAISADKLARSTALTCETLVAL